MRLFLSAKILKCVNKTTILIDRAGKLMKDKQMLVNWD